MSSRASGSFGFRSTIVAIAAALVLVVLPSQASAITPTITNGTGTQWLETGAIADRGSTSSDITISLNVNHDPGLSVTGIKVDDDYDGTDNTTSKTTKTTTLQQPNVVNGFDYSRITYTYNGPTSNSGVNCNVITGGTQRANRPIRVRAVLSNGTETATSSSSLEMIRYDCTSRDDFPVITARSQSATSLNTGDQATFTFTADDSDSGLTSNQTFGGINWRLRRLSDNATTTPTKVCYGDSDNAEKNLNVTFPNRGHWVVEAELLNANDSCTPNPASGAWWRLGSVDVNSPAATSPNVSLNIPRPNLNGNATVTATVDDSGDSGQGGVAQSLEWDLDENTGNGVAGFEDISLGNVATGLTAGQRQRVINTTGKTPGLHTVRVRVGDNGALGGADNIRRTKIVSATYLVDSPPVVNDQNVTAEAGDGEAINLGATDADNDTLSFNVTDPPDHGTLTGAGNNRTYTPDVDYAGADSFTVSVNDGFGGTDTATVSIQVSPRTVIDSGPSGPYNSQDASFEFSSPTAGATFECSLDGATFTSCASPQDYTGLSEGSHTFEVRATAAGNTDPTPASRTFIVDVTEPETTIDVDPGALTNTATPTFEFSSDQPGSTFRCRVDGGSYDLCSSPYTTPNLSDGDHTFEVYAVDPAGNEDPTPASFDFTVDTTAPDTTILTGPNGPTNTSAPQFTFESDDNTATFECKIDTGTFNPCSSPFTTPTLPDGQHTLSVRAVDPANNPDPTPDSRTFTVDTTPPDTAITVDPGQFTNDSTPDFEFNSPTDNDASFQCRVDGGTFQSCTSPFTAAQLDEGSHTFQVRAVDTANNVDPSPASFTFTVDTLEPETTIDDGPSGDINDDTPTFEFSSDESGGTFECRVDSDPFTLCVSPFTTASLSDGQHTFEVRAIDRANNTDSTPASRTFTVDTSVPATTIDSGPTINGDQATFTFSSDEPGASFECQLDTGDFEECTSPQTYRDLAEGSHTFTVRAVDAAGNRDQSPPDSTFNISTQPPETTIDSGPSGRIQDTDAEFEFSSDDATATFECSLDGAAYAACTSPETIPGPLSDGQHNFRVRAVDTDDNADPTPASRNWTVDTTGPATSIDSGPNGLTKNASPSFEFESEDGATFECRIDSTNDADFASCTSPQAYTSLGQGSHTFDVRATDATGNTGAVSSRTFTVDTVAPETTLDASGPTGTTSNTSATFTFSSESGATFRCTLDGQSDPCMSPKSYSGLSDGSHTFSVVATDAAGNTDASPASRTWTIGGTSAPQTSITNGPSGSQLSKDVSFEFTSPAAGATFECKLDSGAFEACTSPKAYTGLATGAHTFSVRAKTGSAVDPTPATRNFSVEDAAPPPSKEPPKISVTSGKVRVAKSVQVATITCGTGPCTLASATAAIKAGKKKVSLKPTISGPIGAGQSAPVTLKLKGKVLRAIAKKGKGKAKIALEATSPAGSAKAATKIKFTAKKKKG